jgi:DNA polymerase-3 subunit alpha
MKQRELNKQLKELNISDSKQWSKIITKTIKDVKKNYDIEIDLQKVDLNDKETYSFLHSGDISNIYYLNHYNIDKFIEHIDVQSFEHLKAMLTLWRPAPMEDGLCDDYIDCKNNKSKIHYIKGLKKPLKPILKSTYGKILYKEQILKIIQILSGMSHEKADLIRYAVLNNYTNEIKQFKKEFIECSVKNGYSVISCLEIFELIVRYSPIAFPENFVIGNALLTFYTLYLKTHFKKEYQQNYYTIVDKNIRKFHNNTLYTL